MASVATSRPMSSSNSRALAPVPGAGPITPTHENATSPTTTQSLTAKQWVIPPRPKPGRKPATDTPPTKRKAQNRAAQRAFRERRAAKVGELEEQLDEIEREHEEVVEGLRAENSALQQSFDVRLKECLENHGNKIRLLQEQIGGWRAHCIQLEQQVDAEKQRADAERKCRLNLESELAIMKGQAVRLPRLQRPSKHVHTQQYNDMRGPEQAYHTPTESSVICNKCSLDRCQCIEDFLNTDDSTHQVKRSGSPPHDSLHSGKRLKRDSPTPSFDDGDMALRSEPVRPVESCGFCQDGSTCPCAELAAERERVEDDHGSRLPSPPREIPKTSATAVIIQTKQTIPQKPNSNGCANSPGTCTQCQSDSSSRRFCQSLAASRTSATAPPPPPPIEAPINTIVPCAAGQACCRISSALSSLASSHQPNTQELDFTTPRSGAPQPNIYATSQAVTGPTLTCADAFTTLAKHPYYEAASKNFGEWLPQLATVPGGHGSSAAQSKSVKGTASTTPVTTPGGVEAPAEGVPARTVFDIEAASVMGVLRFFDRRFGRDM